MNANIVYSTNQQSIFFFKIHFDNVKICNVVLFLELISYVLPECILCFFVKGAYRTMCHSCAAKYNISV